MIDARVERCRGSTAAAPSCGTSFVWTPRSRPPKPVASRLEHSHGVAPRVEPFESASNAGCEQLQGRSRAVVDDLPHSRLESEAAAKLGIERRAAALALLRLVEKSPLELGGQLFSSAVFACSAIFPNASGSTTAISARTLRSSSIPACRQPAMNWLYDSPWPRAPALSDDPQAPHVALARLAVAIGVLERVLDLLLGGAVRRCADPGVPLGLLQDLAALLARADRFTRAISDPLLAAEQPDDRAVVAAGELGRPAKLRLSFADFFSSLWACRPLPAQDLAGSVTLNFFFASLDVFCFGIFGNSCVLRRPEHHDHVAAVEERRRLHHSELLDVLRQPHQQVSPLRMGGLPPAEHDRDLDLRALVEKPNDVAFLVS